VREDLVVGQLHEIGRQDQDAIAARFFRFPGKHHGFVSRYRSGTHDEGPGTPDRFLCQVGQMFALLMAQRPELTCAAADHDSGRAASQQALDVRLKRLLIDVAVGLKRGCDSRHGAGPIDTRSIHDPLAG